MSDEKPKLPAEQYQIVFLLTMFPKDDVHDNPQFMDKEMVYEFLLRSCWQFVESLPKGKMAAVRLILAEKVENAKTEVSDKGPGEGEPGGSSPSPDPIPRA